MYSSASASGTKEGRNLDIEGMQLQPNPSIPDPSCPVLGFLIQKKINECKKRRLSFLKSNSFEISLFQRIIQGEEKGRKSGATL
jgi:hypothetical protein